MAGSIVSRTICYGIQEEEGRHVRLSNRSVSRATSESSVDTCGGGAARSRCWRCLIAPSAHAVTISPLPGTPDASPHTQISFLGVPAGEIHQISVVGSRTGSHRGQLRGYDSAPGASFILDQGSAKARASA